MRFYNSYFLLNDRGLDINNFQYQHQMSSRLKKISNKEISHFSEKSSDVDFPAGSNNEYVPEVAIKNEISRRRR